MGDIPGAREELERHARVLRARLVELLEDLNPDTDLDHLFSGEPDLVDPQGPPRHAYSTVIRAGRPDRD